MDVSIQDWADMTKFLNGYVLETVMIKNNEIIGINSMGVEFILATKPSFRWIAVDGSAFVATGKIIDRFQEIIKEKNMYLDLDSQNQELNDLFVHFIHLFSKDYSN